MFDPWYHKTQDYTHQFSNISKHSTMGGKLIGFELIDNNNDAISVSVSSSKVNVCFEVCERSHWQLAVSIAKCVVLNIELEI